MRVELSRRRLLQAGALAGGGLVLGVGLPERGRASPVAGDSRFAPNAWLRITPDGRIVFTVDRSEMGQGVTTSLPQLLAEELEVDPESIDLEFAPVDPAYRNPAFRAQATGASTSVASSWEPLRKAGAAAREMLVRAAAESWGTDVAACTASAGGVTRDASGERLSYAELAPLAASFPVPENPRLKDPSEFRVIGRSVGRLDAASKTDGSAVFAMDVELPGLRTAVVLRCPVFGGRLRGYAGDLPAGVEAVEISSGLAVVADGYWAARRAADALEIDWEEGPNADLSSASIAREQRELAQQRIGEEVHSEGDVDAALEGASKRLEAIYEAGFQAHATMEPQNCTAWVREHACDVWAPTQAPAAAQGVAADAARLPRRLVNVHQTLLGGGFGRRGDQDFVVEAVEVSAAVGAPVRLIWSREDDIRHDGNYRPATTHLLRGGLDADGVPVAWSHHVVGGSVFRHVAPKMATGGLPGWMPRFVRRGLAGLAGRVMGGLIDDPTSTEGASHPPYAIANLRVAHTYHRSAVPLGLWRSVGHSYNAFAVEGFIDELAVAAGADPYQFRRALMVDQPRQRRVLELAATRSGWDRPPPSGRARGIAVHESFGTAVAQVAEVSVSGEEIRVHRVVCAVDCGQVINPDLVASQMESSIAFGLSAALKSEITIANGRVEQSNFHDFPVLRINEMPDVEVFLVESREPPSGVGEPGTPPIAPAVANAVFAATGRRLRRLPLRLG